MREIVIIIKEQTDILFKNMYEQINNAELGCMVDNVNNSRFLFHMIHSRDKYFINPYDYSYDEVCKLTGIDEKYSIISESREGYLNDPDYVIAREILVTYMDFVKGKINGCVNKGFINGDLNVGGIAGIIAFEYDSDREDDLEEENQI